MKKILLIVDDWEAQERYEEKISSLGEIHCAPFAREGIEVARTWTPDLIFLDLTLEDMTADEALTELRSDPKTASIPLAIVAESREAFLRHPCLKAEDWIVERPFEFALLIASLKNLL